MAYSNDYQRAMADIDAQIAEIELLRTRRGDMPLPPKVPGKNASKEELQQYVKDQDAYELAVKQANSEQQDIDVLKGERKLTEAQAKQKDAYSLISNKVGNAKRSVGNNLSRSNQWLANIPTPGGIWVPFLILMGLFLVLFPVNGHSRISWLFLVITKNARWTQSNLPNLGIFGFEQSVAQSQKQTTLLNTGSAGSLLYNGNTNPNTSPGTIISSMPAPTNVVNYPPSTGGNGNTLQYLTNPVKDTNQSSGYFDSLFSTGVF